MAYIQQRGERKYKITVCNGYKPNGQKRMQARTITVPREVLKRGIQQYVMAEASAWKSGSAPASTRAKTLGSKIMPTAGWNEWPNATKSVH